MASKSRNLSIGGRGLTNFESIMWVFTRLSALGMYALILFAIIGALIMGARNNMNLADVLRWGFMPNVTHVQSTALEDTTPFATPSGNWWPAPCFWWQQPTACTAWW